MREITNKERQFVSILLKRSHHQVEIPEMVISMKDGRMGSISFDLKGDQSRTRQIIAGNFKDKDGVIVDFELTADNEGNLFELDIWKVDFSPLISLPNEKEIKITAHNKGYKS
jgi:hypothetical protein